MRGFGLQVGEGMIIISFAISAAAAAPSASGPNGFHGAKWGATPSEVREAVGAKQWQAQGKDNGFPAELNVSTYSAIQEIAGYSAKVIYYFYNDSFFQATASFQFPHLVNFDFNYNVYRSVDEYYRAIRDCTVSFVYDVYDLLKKKYGRREPVFDGLDPRRIFADTDAYLRREQWNLRYHPYEYYRRIAASCYARWNYPKTRVTFSVDISAIDKRFDYILSATSLDMEERINRRKDDMRAQGL